MKLQNLIHILFGIVCIGLLPGAKAVDVQQAWVVSHPASTNAVAVDASGNVYVTGATFSMDTHLDYATIKYNSAGQEQWFASYDGPKDPYTGESGRGDVAKAIAVDGSGNVYVTGKSDEGFGVEQSATIKYNSAGRQQWVARSNVQSVSAIALDSLRNVYVTGTIGGGYATIKYNSAGQQQWVARFNAPNKSAFPKAIAVDGLGNAYVTGSIGDPFDEEEYATVKYNSAGQQQWVARYNGIGNDSVSGIALDSSGNVYVTGSSDDSNGFADYATIKYNSAGQQQWVARYNGPANYGNDVANAIAVDGLGNVYVTGSSDDVDGWEAYATIKYDSAGQEQWVARYDGPPVGYAEVSAIALDSSGNVYVTGSRYTALLDNWEYATVKYDSAGQQQWSARYTTDGNDRAYAIAVDPSGYVYVTATENVTIKYVQEVVATNAASNITSASAKLNGAVNPNGLTTTVHFEYGLTPNYGSTTVNSSHAGNTTQSVSANIPGLSPNTTYHFRLVATNDRGTKYGSDRIVRTFSPTGPPVVTTSTATNVARFSATLNGSVYPHGLSTTVYFQYGTTTSYGLTTAPQTETGNTYQSVSANISGLSPSTTYHFRLVSTNSAGTLYGSDRMFTTLVKRDVVDFNGDGHPDYLLSNSTTQATVIWYMNNNVHVTSTGGPTLPVGWQVVGTADFNGDGDPDYLLSNSTTHATVIWYMNNNVHVTSASGPTLPVGWQVVGTADFNGDGDPDYLLSNSTTQATVIWYMNNNVHVTSTGGPTLPVGWQVVGTADFNGDGDPDYLLSNSTTHATVIWYMNNNVHVTSASGPTLPVGWQVVGTADFNGDGDPDYLLSNSTTQATVIWYMNNNVHVTGASGPTIPGGWSLAAP